MKKPELSVVICTLKKRRSILEMGCLPALQEQTFKNFEIIVIKDKGLSEARNEGINRASSNFVAFIDDDATPKKGWVENIVKHLQAADGITGKTVHPRNDIWRSLPRHYNQGNEKKNTNMICGCNMAFRQDVFKNVGMFDEYFTWGHDEYDFLLRYLKKYSLVYAPDVVVEHCYAKNLRHYLKKRFLFGKKNLYLWMKHSKCSTSDIIKRMLFSGCGLTKIGLISFLGRVSEDFGILCSVIKTKQKEIKEQLTAIKNKRHYEVVCNSLKTGKALSPRQITIEITNRCTARCIFCKRWKIDAEDIKKELKTAEWKKIIRDCKKVGTEIVSFSGGEPFLREDILELIDETKKHGLKVHINTNGYLLLDLAEQLATCNVDLVVVSIDSMDPGKHDDIRKVQGLWERAIAGVKKLKSLGVNVAIGAVLFKNNLEEVSDYLNFSKELEVGFRFQPIHDDIHDLKVEDKKILFSERDVRELKSATELIRKENLYWIDDVYYALFTLFLTDPQKFIGVKCPVAARFIYFINPYGDVFPCESRRDLRMGNVKEMSLRQIIDSTEAENTRNLLYSSKRNCVCWYRCTAPGNIFYQFADSLPENGDHLSSKGKWQSKINEIE